MGKKVSRTLFWASVTIMLCMVMIVGGTFAFWSKDVSVKNHLVAGKLNLKLERTALSKTMLDNSGYMTTETYSAEKAYCDFTDSSSKNVFDFDVAKERIVPTSCYEATLKLTNNGSVAFTYQIIIDYEDFKEGDVNLSTALKDQLMVSVNDNTAQPLSAFETDGSNQVVIGAALARDATTTFTVKVEFKNDDAVNNAAMEKTVNFDLIVKAEQLTSKPTSAASDD